MEAGGSSRTRKSRYRPAPECARPVTPRDLTALEWTGRLVFLTAVQLALLMSVPEQTARRILRNLHDHMLVKPVILPRAVIAEPDEDPLRATFGSFANLYVPTAKGVRLLRRAGRNAPTKSLRSFSHVNWLHIKHEIGVIDSAIFFLRAAVANGHRIEHLHFGQSAIIDLQREQAPRTARPDAWLTYHFGAHVWAGCIEFDTGTERGTRHWDAKLEAYKLLFAGHQFQSVTGQSFGRVAVVCRTAKRRDQLAVLIQDRATPGLAARFWIADKADLMEPDLSKPVWRQPGVSGFTPLVPSELYEPDEGGLHVSPLL